MKKISYIIFLIFYFLIQNSVYSSDENTIKVESVINACIESGAKDKICEALVEFKQVGDDAIEAVKTYIHLTPKQYFLLTLANMAANNRIRIKTRSYFIRDGTDILDIRKDYVGFAFELQF